MKIRILILLLLLAAAYFVAFWGLGELPFVGADEPRYARISEEMNLRSDYVTPTLEFKPWLEKPPMLFWLQALSFRVFGVSEWSARFPNASLMVMTALFLAWFGRRIGGNKVGLFAFTIGITAFPLIVFGRAGSTDLPFTAFLTMAFAFGYLMASSGSVLMAAVTGFFLGAATLAKGPLAIVLFLMVFVFYAVVIQQEIWNLKILLVGVFSTLLTSGPWLVLVWIANGENFFYTFFVHHHLARFVTDIHHHRQPFWYFLPILIFAFFPWFYFLGSSIRRLWGKRRQLGENENRTALFLWIWAMLPFLFFSYSTAKLPGYILPIFPPLILLAATEWVRIWDGQKTLIPWILTSITALIFTVATISAFHQSFGGLREGVYLSSPFLIVAIAGLVAALKNKIKLAFVAMASSIVLTILLIVVIAFPLIGGHFSTKTIVEDAKPFISKDKPLILYRYFDLTAHYYSNYSTTRGEVYNPENLADYIVKNKQDQYFLLTNDQGLGEIKEKYEPVIISHRHIFYLVRIPHPGLNND